jgi:hypothetical protein
MLAAQLTSHGLQPPKSFLLSDPTFGSYSVFSQCICSNIVFTGFESFSKAACLRVTVTTQVVLDLYHSAEMVRSTFVGFLKINLELGHFSLSVLPNCETFYRRLRFHEIPAR